MEDSPQTLPQSLRILLVEDVLTDREVVRHMLAASPLFSVKLDWSERLGEALALCAEHEYDVILLDLGLPDSEGLDTFRSIKREAHGVPILILSSTDDARIATSAVEEGAQDYLVKGRLTPQAIHRVVRYTIERSRLMRELNKAHQRLQADYENLHAILENSADGILIVDEENTLRYANPAAGLLLERDREELVGTTYEFAPSSRGGHEELQLERGNGQLATVELREAKVSWAGRPSRLVTIREITQQKRREEELRQSGRTFKLAFDAKRREMEQIARMHARFVPHSIPPAAGLEFVPICRPCADVGGDFYQVLEIVGGRVAICMADVSGHGALAALAASTLRALLFASLREATSSEGPGDVLFRLARWFQGQLGEEQFATAWLGFWNPGTEVLTYASGAHPQAVLMPGGAAPRFLEHPPGLPIGIEGIEPEKLQEREVSLDVGDRFFLYTDGWTETQSARGDVLEGPEFLDFLGNSEGQPIQATPALLFMEFERHAANARVRDDLTMLVIDRVE